jgi:hypothetical protein
MKRPISIVSILFALLDRMASPVKATRRVLLPTWHATTSAVVGGEGYSSSPRTHRQDRALQLRADSAGALEFANG